MYTLFKSDTVKWIDLPIPNSSAPSGHSTTDQTCNFVYIDISATELHELKFQNKTTSKTWQRRGYFLPDL